jgi:hypothetical protein
MLVGVKYLYCILCNRFLFLKFMSVSFFKTRGLPPPGPPAFFLSFFRGCRPHPPLASPDCFFFFFLLLVFYFFICDKEVKKFCWFVDIYQFMLISVFFSYFCCFFTIPSDITQYVLIAPSDSKEQNYCTCHIPVIFL